MPKASPIQGNFNAGEFSPLLSGRTDVDRYKQALATCKNYVPFLQGPVSRRPGTRFVSEVADSTKRTRLIPFEFSQTQAYALEFSEEKIRFYSDRGLILASQNIYLLEGRDEAEGFVDFYSTRVSNEPQGQETVSATTSIALNDPLYLTSPYLEADLFDLKFTQSADNLYITHPEYAPMKLQREGADLWTLQEINFKDGPYLPQDASGITLTPSGATGVVTLTTGPSVAVAGAANNGSGLIRIEATGHGKQSGDEVCIIGIVGTVEANTTLFGVGQEFWSIKKIDANHFDLIGSTFTHAYVSGGTVYPNLFKATDFRRVIRLKEVSTWGWGFINTASKGYEVSITVLNTLTNTNAKTIWRFGMWSDSTGYPAAVTFHQDRLCFAGTRDYPQRIDFSASSDYENFLPSALDGTITDGNALSFSLNSNDVNAIKWLISDERGLLAGSLSGEWVVRPSAASEALTPTNVNASQSTNYGSSAIQPVRAGKAKLFIQRAGRKLREMAYFYEVDGFRASDVTILSQHITNSGIVDMAYQKEPQPIVWAVREDGVLAGMTYDRDQDAIRVGWARHILGGTSNLQGHHALVESVAVIPSPDGSSEELWVVVKRYIGGLEFRYVEYVTEFFDDTMNQRDAIFLDCSLSYDNPLIIESMTTNAMHAHSAVFHITAHGLNNGDKIAITSQNIGPDDPPIEREYFVSDKTSGTFEAVDSDGLYLIYATAAATPIPGDEVRKFVTTISGLSHLDGDLVSILGDGAVQEDQIVQGGEITLESAATIVHIGYSYESDGQLLRIDAGAADGTSIGKTRRTNLVGMMLHRTLGIQIGMNFDTLFEPTFRTSVVPLGSAVPLFTGIISENVGANYDFENQFCWRQSGPLPGTVLAVMPSMVTQDR